MKKGISHMRSYQGLAPESVELIYRVVGNTHVFSSKGIKGLLHVGSESREKAFNSAIPALNALVTEAYACEAVYKLDMTYENFCQHVESADDISGNFLHVTLEKDCGVSH